MVLFCWWPVLVQFSDTRSSSAEALPVWAHVLQYVAHPHWSIVQLLAVMWLSMLRSLVPGAEPEEPPAVGGWVSNGTWQPL
jgi:hypothetical protein